MVRNKKIISKTLLLINVRALLINILNLFDDDTIDQINDELVLSFFNSLIKK